MEALTGLEPAITVLQTIALTNLAIAPFLTFNNNYYNKYNLCIVIYYSILSLFLVSFICGEIFLLGKHFSKRNNLFESNGASLIVFGAIIYFLITYLFFFPFVWVSSSINYFVVIFFIKETLQVTYLFIKRDSFKKLNINLSHILITFLTIIIIPIIFNFGLNKLLNLKIQKQNNTFQIWILYKETIASFTKIEYEFLCKWVFTPIATFIIYNSISSFTIQYSKKKNWIEYLISFLITIFLLSTFNFGWSIDSMIGIYLILFAVLISANIIIYSRRRYALIYGMIVFNIWFLEPNLFLSISILGIIVGFIYTIKSGPKASLFLVQIISPNLIILSLWMYAISSLGALTLTILALISYLFIISVGHSNLLEKIDIQINKIRFLIPLVILVTLLSLSIYFLSKTKQNLIDIFLLDNAILDSFGNKKWNFIQSIIFYIWVLILCISIIYLKIIKSKIINNKIILLISFTFILIAYNALFKILLIETNFENQFIYLRIISFMPLIILSLIMLKRNFIFLYQKNINYKTF